MKISQHLPQKKKKLRIIKHKLEAYNMKPVKHVFILGGQSNMSGRGGVHRHQWNGKVPAEAAEDGDKIFRLNAGLEWEVAHEPLHQGLDGHRACGVGPGLVFGNAVKELVGVVGLVPCAAAGTQMKDWVRGAEHYETMVKRAKAAAAHGGEIAALLWYHGEKDTFLKEDADLYGHNIEKLILNLRQDLHLPSLPVIMVALASGRDKYLEKVRDAQKGINLANVVCVDALGLALEDDNLHITTEAHIKLGHMMAHSYLTHFLTL
ncbi:probable carbohydrate esterase At4g34215 [Salvia miltiorrhiza]|uniref:probable carbohydrate esterase At4g34215 n=1 Tax=Salvia miltiorrhiza TaxID=226208 RepID=UPI0025AD5BB1|nr:probable carbohydrate esterase At4g34215 [Salvia miltiorrhiza]